MNADNGPTVDLTNCDREPIHLLGAVQPFGFLLAVAADDWHITHASANAAAALGVAPDALIGRPLDAVVAQEPLHTIRGLLQGVSGDMVARGFALDLVPGLRCDIAAHVIAAATTGGTADTVVIECEWTAGEGDTAAAGLARDMIARLQRTDDQKSFFRTAAREMRALTGFDRVMVYRFDEDGSGEVVAEAVDPGRGSFLGLHYPASDIPRQARVLYARNVLRIIPDIEAAPVPVVPGEPDGAPLDLSMSVLRSVSAIHIEYLRNMGVRASMSVSILRDDRLWGLFACHHYAPHRVAFGRRTAAELFAQVFSLLLENRERAAEAAYEARAQALHHRLVTSMAREATRFESVVAHLDDMADLLACDGIGVWTNGRATLKGLTPDADAFAALVAHIDGQAIDKVQARKDIGAEYPPGRAFAERAAGMLVVPLSRPARDYLVFFRREMARSVSWAGDPTVPKFLGPNGDRLTPRKSFETWKQTVTGQSLPWLPVECRIAEQLRVSLLEVILQLSDLTEEERRRAIERQDLLIAELNHRIRNILGLIRGVITQSRDSASTIEAFTEVVGGRIQALARAHDQITADHWGPASLRSLIAAEAAAYLGKGERVRLAGPDVLIEPEAFTTIALVVHEMITNSAKYGALSDQRGRVDIAAGFGADGALALRWRESGGPPVSPPKRRGFGSTVIERSIRHDLKGEASVDYAPTGLVARFVIPGAYVRPAPGGAIADAPVTEAAAPAGHVPQYVLLVEDTMIIALDAEDMLRRLGVDAVRVAASVKDALAAIAQRPPHFALLDVNLGAESSFAVATELRALGVPFAFATGYGEQAAFPPAFAETPRLRKPYTAETLRMLIEPFAPGPGGET
ncbi:HWE histidine kinase domain-containing protein [Rhodoplanes sp. TEM]|uniref:histidine kinase n=1 Tax=Rhodoplanes tepidamans TaxID=200616 RepID=A0ABT5J567_RHOTP|nr:MULTISPECIES: HWE histidine kinase domain-containing protein [Rhodoplanes]MDC7784459.1 HWE histidine kinase domain-containing protein [Rhodoplanes tepidamans]MDC7983489.1 HWE histidine kinase domain-containing protein [Rhodoplanes sp. TEM]MDQ0356966.1 light-regulated signal transduction histidine kinase (bacteriophytochrome) [Rhodoplanes tepidamans]